MSGLRVLITTGVLSTRTGAEMFTCELALALAARGHTPLVYSPELGPLGVELAAKGIEVRDRLDGFSRAPDIVHGHHTVPTVHALLHFRDVAGIYVCHAATDTPPVFPRIIQHVAVDHYCAERLIEAGVPAERARVIYNWVDLSRFKPRGPLPARPARALLFSNYASERTYLAAVRDACDRAGLPLDVIGLGVGNPSAEPEAVLGRYDVVFAKARCALEAMAVGTAVILCDFRGVGEMVTSADVDELRRWNFGARVLRSPVEPQILLAQIARYDPNDAAEVSRRIRTAAGLDGQVDQYVALYREVLSEWARAPRPDRRMEKRAAAAALRRVLGPPRLRERIRQVPLLGSAAVMAKRAVFGPRVWR